MRLRSLSEAECYARCATGADTTEQVSQARLLPRPVRMTTVRGEDLRLLFERASRRARDGGRVTRTCRTWAAHRRPPVAAGRRPVAPLPSSWFCTATWTQSVPRCRPPAQHSEPAFPTSSRPGLACIFCGINPGRVSAAAAAHFANPRNDFWRLLHDAGFTPRLYEPHEQFGLSDLGFGRDERRVPDDAGLGRPSPW